MALYLCCLVLFLTGLYCVAVKRNAVKMIMDTGLQSLLSALLAAGSAVSIILIAMALRLYQRFGTFDTDKMRKLKG
jgi:multisubunit Na+/H+ antiporter MnhC subunit